MGIKQDQVISISHLYCSRGKRYVLSLSTISSEFLKRIDFTHNKDNIMYMKNALRRTKSFYDLIVRLSLATEDLKFQLYEAIYD